MEFVSFSVVTSSGSSSNSSNPCGSSSVVTDVSGDTGTIPTHVYVPLHIDAVLTPFERDIIDDFVHQTLPQVPQDTLKSLSYLKNAYKVIFDKQYRKELTKVDRLILLRRITYACIIRQVILNDQCELSTYERLKMMPFFQDENLEFAPTSVEEVNSLRRFMRVIRVMHELGFPGLNNKHTYIETAAMLEGSKRSYALGGAPSKATIRRLMIFHAITGIPSPSDLIQRFKRRRKLS